MESNAVNVEEKPTTARPKITIVGAGMVGGTVAQLAMQNYADLVLIDIVDGLPQGKALDLLEAGPVLGYDTHLEGSNGYAEAIGSDVVVITSGIARKPGMSRDDLLRTNMGIVEPVTAQIASVSPDAIIIVVSNPLDAMCHVAFDAAGFPRKRVIGQAGVLDSARYRMFIAGELDVPVEDVTTFVLGGHGDSMVPLSRYCTVAGIPITELMPAARIRELEERTANGGAEIVGLLKTGSACYALAAPVVDMVDAIILDKKRVFPASVLLQGEYGIADLYVGVPIKLGQQGVEYIFEVRLTEQEQAALSKAATAIRDPGDAWVIFGQNSRTRARETSHA